MITADELEPLENLVARRIREELGEGRLDKLIQAQQAVQKSIAIHVPAAKAHASMPAPTVTVTDGAAQPQSIHATLHVQPIITGELELIPREAVDEAVDAIRAASPGLADDIQNRSPQEIMLALNFFTVLMQVVQVTLTAIPLIHPEPATQTQIIEMCKQTINCVMNVPPAQS
ncbi:MAG: hypothetical protein ACRDT5_04710 [Mycobacterium sp.]